jgi:hypothetical protein
MENFYSIDVPGATVYVDTDNPIAAGKVALFRNAKFRHTRGRWLGTPANQSKGQKYLRSGTTPRWNQVLGCPESAQLKSLKHLN